MKTDQDDDDGDGDIMIFEVFPPEHGTDTDDGLNQCYKDQDVTSV